MCTENNECNGGCNDNCPNRTSEITLWDGTFTNITVPADSSLNDVLALLENYATTTATCNDINYTLSAFSACLNLPAGTYSFTQIIDAIVATICATSSSLSDLEDQVNAALDLNTTNVTLDGIVLPSCFSAFAGTTSTDLFNTILSSLCGVLNDVAPLIDDPITVTPPDPGTQADPGGTNASSKSSNSRMEHVAEALKSFVDNNSYIYSHTAPTVKTTSFVVELEPMRGIVENFLVVRDISEDLTVNASMDTYFYLSGDSTILRREVALAAPAPATPSLSHSLYKIVSDGSGVVSVTNLFTSNALNAIPLAADDVATVHIQDDAVTTVKLADVVVGAPVGHVSLFEIENNDKGQVITLNSNLLLSGLANGQILIYNSGLNRFENADNTAVNTIGRVPKVDAAGTNYDDSSIAEGASQVQSLKKVEINTGAAEDDADAILNMVGGPMLAPRLTAVEASALPLNDGYFVYVRTTDATFTSVGFWGVESAVWVKL